MSLFGCLSHYSHADENALTADEPKLRAAIVLGILRFSTWPDDLSKHSSFNLCSLGKPASEIVLTKVNSQYQYQNLPINTYSLNINSRELADCNAVLLGREVTGELWNRVLGKKDLHGVLTICDDCKNPNLAMVSLIRKDNRIGFVIDLKKANKHGINFSSMLLELAHEVRKP